MNIINSKINLPFMLRISSSCSFFLHTYYLHLTPTITHISMDKKLVLQMFLPWSLSEVLDEAPVRSQPCPSRPQLYRWMVLRKTETK